MSPMIDIQRRHADVFRIRLGDKDGNRPRKLTDRMRITARSAEIVQAFVDVYGGEVTPWEGQFQTYLPTTELRVLVLPGQSIQQWWEQYRGSVCQRRCDGYQEQKSGNRCMCPEDIYERAEDKNACSPMTRVNVLCPDVALLGAGSLVTHSMIAAETLPQSIAVAEMALARGLMVPAVLRVVLNDKGRNHFIYPQIEIIGMSMNSLAAGETMAALPHATKTAVADLEGAAAPALGAGNGQANPDMTPVPPSVQQRPARPVAEQAANVGQQPGTRRKNAAAPIPSTGLAPRTAAEAEAATPGPPAASGGEDLDGLSKAQLQLRCRDAGKPVSGTKDELIVRLREASDQVSGQAGSAAAVSNPPDPNGEPPAAGGQQQSPPPPDDGEPERPPYDRDGAQKVFHVRLRDLGLDYETRVRPWLQAQYRATLSKLTDEQLHRLLSAMEHRAAEVVASIEDHEHAGGNTPDDGPGDGDHAGYQQRIRDCWRHLAQADHDAYAASWKRIGELARVDPSSQDWSGADLEGLQVEAERLEAQVAVLRERGDVR